MADLVCLDNYCERGGTVYTLVLEASAERIGSSNLPARTTEYALSLERWNGIETGNGIDASLRVQTTVGVLTMGLPNG